MALQLLVMTPQALLYNGVVTAVSSINAKGKFDVLEEHANFISLIAEYLEIRTQDGNARRIKIEQGVLRVSNDQIKVFLGLWGSGGTEQKKQG